MLWIAQGALALAQPPDGRPAPGAPGRGAAAAPAPPAAVPAVDPASGWAEIRIIKPDPDAQQLSRMKFNLKRVLQSREKVGELGLKQCDDYFELFMLPQISQPQHLDKAPELRDELMEQFAIVAKVNNQATFDHVNDLVLDYAQMIARGPVRAVAANGKGMDVLWNGDPTQPAYWKLGGGADGRDRGPISAAAVARRESPQKNFHPACRYNAMLIIGRLNEKMTWQPARRVFEETPLRKALRPMVEAAGNDKLPEPVRLAAMIGIRRHIDKGQLPAGALDLICGVMSRVCKERTTATGHLADGHLWIRRQAIELMGACGTEGQGQVYSRLLTERLADPNEPLSVRQAAAAALAKVQGRTKLKPGEAAELAGKLGTLAVDLARYELDPAPLKQPHFSKRRVADGFDCVVLALGGKSARHSAPADAEQAKGTGILAAAPSNEQPYVQGLINRISALRTACGTSQQEAALRNVLSEGASDITVFAAAGPEAALNSPEKGPMATPEGAPADAKPAGDPKPADGTQPPPMTPMDNPF
ncbi:MAG: hypothetical protein K8T91_18665 [Planctomycetes bacterium]|nr:hypothetical protein [Planctomycetota bacterium]